MLSYNVVALNDADLASDAGLADYLGGVLVVGVNNVLHECTLQFLRYKLNTNCLETTSQKKKKGKAQKETENLRVISPVEC